MTSGPKKTCVLRSSVSKSSIAMGQVSLMMLFVCLVTWTSGCSHHNKKETIQFSGDCVTNGPCQSMLQQIEYPTMVCDDSDETEFYGSRPMTITDFQETEAWELTIEECVELALANSKIMQKLGGVVVNAPQGVTTLYDQGLFETSQGGVEAALSDFDAQVSNSLFLNRTERVFNNQFALVSAGAVSTQNSYQFQLSKQTASGASLAFRSTTSYNKNNSAANLFQSNYDIVNLMEFRQPLMRGRGTMVNRVAGPNSLPGQYNGVLISRIRSDISLADFEAAVRDLVFDVENNYWELYFAYRDLDTKIEARESARETWENRKLRYDNGLSRPDDEAQARGNYYSFDFQAQDALAGKPNGQLGVLGAERNLRRLMGIPAGDGRVIRPSSEPSVAPVVFDWEESQVQALGRRVEIRRQKWAVRQRELELCAAKALNKWQFDMIGQYGFRGFGDNLFGSIPRPSTAGPTPGGGAFNDMIVGDLDDWQLGFEFGGAIGNRRGHLAIRNAELNLVREKSILKEQQRQILHDLNAAYVEVDRAMANLKTSLNARIASEEELVPKQKRVKEGQENIFFLLDAEQRVALTESAVHRSVADYNRALLAYAYTAGTLLARNNIRLTEGAWSADAQNRAFEKAPRYERTGPNTQYRDTQPVSIGPFSQTAPALAGNVDQDGTIRPMGGAAGAPPESRIPAPQPNERSVLPTEQRVPAPAPESSGEAPASIPPADRPDTEINPPLNNQAPLPNANEGEFSKKRFDFSDPSSIAAKYLKNRARRR